MTSSTTLQTFHPVISIDEVKSIVSELPENASALGPELKERMDSVLGRFCQLFTECGMGSVYYRAKLTKTTLDQAIKKLTPCSLEQVVAIQPLVEQANNVYSTLSKVRNAMVGSFYDQWPEKDALIGIIDMMELPNFPDLQMQAMRADKFERLCIKVSKMHLSEKDYVGTEVTRRLREVMDLYPHTSESFLRGFIAKHQERLQKAQLKCEREGIDIDFRFFCVPNIKELEAGALVFEQMLNKIYNEEYPDITFEYYKTIVDMLDNAEAPNREHGNC